MYCNVHICTYIYIYIHYNRMQAHEIHRQCPSKDAPSTTIHQQRSSSNDPSSTLMRSIKSNRRWTPSSIHLTREPVKQRIRHGLSDYRPASPKALARITSPTCKVVKLIYRTGDVLKRSLPWPGLQAPPVKWLNLCRGPILGAGARLWQAAPCSAVPR